MGALADDGSPPEGGLFAAGLCLSRFRLCPSVQIVFFTPFADGRDKEGDQAGRNGQDPVDDKPELVVGRIGDRASPYLSEVARP